MEAAEREAARAMSDAAADMFARPIAAEESSIEVRDDLGLLVRVGLKIEIERFRRAT